MQLVLGLTPFVVPKGMPGMPHSEPVEALYQTTEDTQDRAGKPTGLPLSLQGKSTELHAWPLRIFAKGLLPIQNREDQHKNPLRRNAGRCVGHSAVWKWGGADESSSLAFGWRRRNITLGTGAICFTSLCDIIEAESKRNCYWPRSFVIRNYLHHTG